jgi:hypothetical protein
MVQALTMLFITNNTDTNIDTNNIDALLHNCMGKIGVAMEEP